ncbi:LPXTG cell wall anchor domain-containing protein, partial [Staphylococcus simulans]
KSPEATQIVKDTVVPVVPVINTIEAGDKVVSGTSEPLSTVTLTLPNGKTAEVKADDKGVWTTTLETPLAHNEVIKAVASDVANNKSPEATQTVKDTVAPKAPVVNEIKSTDQVISGTTEANSNVFVVLANGKILETKADAEGNWNVELLDGLSLVGNETVKVYAKDLADNQSDTVESKIVSVEVPAEPEEETPSEPAPEVPVEETTPTEPTPEVTPEVPVEEATPTEPEVPVEEVPEVPTEPEAETPTEPTPEVTPEVPVEETTPTEPEVPVEEVPEVPAEPEAETPTTPVPEVTPEVPVEEATPTEPAPEVTPEVPVEETTPAEPEVPVEEMPEVPTEPEVETPTEPIPEVTPEEPAEEATSTEPEVPVEEVPEVPTKSEVSEEETTSTGSETPVVKEPVEETKQKEETSTESSPSKEDTVVESKEAEENDEATVENNDTAKESTGEVTTHNDIENVKTKSVKKDVQDKKSTTLNSKTFTHKKESKTNKQALPETGNETSSMPLLGSLLTLFGLGFIARRFNKNEKTDK